MSCECISACPFFNDKMTNMPAMASIYKKKYCEGNFEECARWIVFKGSGKLYSLCTYFSIKEGGFQS